MESTAHTVTHTHRNFSALGTHGCRHNVAVNRSRQDQRNLHSSSAELGPQSIKVAMLVVIGQLIIIKSLCTVISEYK
jgi:hypothetical protein